MKTNLPKKLTFSLIVATVIFPLLASASGDQGSAAVTGENGMQTAANVGPKAAPANGCVGCHAAQAAADVGGNLADPPSKYEAAKGAKGSGPAGSSTD